MLGDIQKIKNILDFGTRISHFQSQITHNYLYRRVSGKDRGSSRAKATQWGDKASCVLFKKANSDAQNKKKAIYIEILAVMETKYWRYWLIGHKFEAITDHKPLAHFNLRARTDEELADISYYLLQYDFLIMYRPGKGNKEANALPCNFVVEI